MIAEFRRAIQFSPNYVDAHFALAEALRLQGLREEALAELREALRLDPTYFQAHLRLALLLNDQGKHEEALAEHREAIRLKPEHSTLHTGFGMTLLAQGRHEEALAEHQEALRLDPNDSEAHHHFGHALLTLGKPEMAIAEFREASRLDTHLSEPHRDLGEALEKQKKTEEAFAEFREAIRLNPTDPEHHHRFGHALQNNGKRDEALDEYREARKRTWPGYRAAAEVDYHIQSLEREISIGRRLPALLKGVEIPKDATEELAVAMVCYRESRHSDAVRFFADAFTRDPTLAAAFRAGHRYNAACSAAMAGCGKDKDALPADESARAKLRTQARDWLKADLALYSTAIRVGSPEGLRQERKHLDHWKADSDLVGIRNADALAKLPEAERAEWKAFWTEVDVLLTKAGGEKPKL